MLILFITLMCGGVLFTWLSYGLSLGILHFVVLGCHWTLFPILVGFGPFGVLITVDFFCNSVRNEAILIRQVGQKRALWYESPNFHSTFGFSWPAKTVARAVVTEGHDTSGQYVKLWAQLDSLPTELQEMIEGGFMDAGSILWSKFILFLESIIGEHAALSAGFVSWVVWTRTARFRLAYPLNKFAYHLVTLLVLVWHFPADVAFSFIWKCLRYAVMLTRHGVPRGLKDFFEFCQWWVVSIIVDILGYNYAVNTEYQRYYSENLMRGKVSYTNNVRTLVMNTVVFINDLGLPEFVRARFSKSPTLENIRYSNQLMSDLGWPINVAVTDSYKPNPYTSWTIGGTDFATGVRQLKMKVDKDLDGLRLAAIHYKRTEEYRTEENELQSLARYFKRPSYDFPDLLLDDVWEVVRDIFATSRLTSFNHIIRMWEKKYALGAFMKSPYSIYSKYKRSIFIRDLGGMSNFKKLWATTFYWASQMVPVAHVSVKDEALPPRKWMADKVRTVIGSPVAHYIMSTIWNYGPNHNFKWETTPIKVGMPLNGYWMTRIWQQHSRAQIHVEGDFSNFDSTLSGKIMSLVKEVRKKGYET